MLNIPVDDIKSLDATSIDEAEENFDNTLESLPKMIPTKVEFWGHCSNLQVWVEMNYYTRLLHRTLAFPLLKALSKA